MEKNQATETLLDLCDRYLKGEKLEEVKDSINQAFKERNDVIVKYALAEIDRYGEKIKNKDTEVIKELFFYFG
ncbi:hypothetical protein [Pelagicoccus sp. SDUM812005]|uniref:hypothetical protein n=1 Tax=Pelagicoccus sp. SDUM812005 TaxID=3041257 RepID=UPI00280DDEB3|nr:hypothetical protein [Pelagicoccus sp. SDUM812005]MDQ8183894.1 hypothetical protein [Pelagicoccus sp. SDUM812005]